MKDDNLYQAFGDRNIAYHPFAVVNNLQEAQQLPDNLLVFVGALKEQ